MIRLLRQFLASATARMHGNAYASCARHRSQSDGQMDRPVNVYPDIPRCHEEAVRPVLAQGKAYRNEARDREWLQRTLQRAWFGSETHKNLRHMTGLRSAAHGSKLYAFRRVFLAILAIRLSN